MPDYAASPAVHPATINTLASCAWIRAGEPLRLIGDSGTGKSHLLIGLGAAAATAGYRVRYVLAAKLVNELVEAAEDKQLNKTIARYGRVDLLCIGYMELDRRGAELLFQVLTDADIRRLAASRPEPAHARPEFLMPKWLMERRGVLVAGGASGGECALDEVARYVVLCAGAGVRQFGVAVASDGDQTRIRE